ncbi:hypothetical protein [Cohaesibacter celericrescens]|uniref:hypothetical protein n=1 Tax=Cohaesibacter celericrescens TaxID=2067669 RepID=UPI0015E15641|nr:hypothetical protein [Cohaesibacter celericrescens]
MSIVSRTLGKIFAAREEEARRHLQIYLRTADRDLLEANGFDADELKLGDPKYLPF